MMKNQIKSLFFTYKKEINFIDINEINQFIDNFFDTLKIYPSNKAFKVIFKVKYSDFTYRSFSRFILINNSNESKQMLKDSAYSIYMIYGENYNQLVVDSFIMNYILLSDEISLPNNNNNLLKNPDIMNNELTDFKFLPLSMNITNWSNDIIFINANKKAIILLKDFIMDFNISQYFYTLTIKYKGNEILKIKDTFFDKNINLKNIIKDKTNLLNTFNRKLYKKVKKRFILFQEFEYKEGELIFSEISSNRNKFIKFNRLRKNFKNNKNEK